MFINRQVLVKAVPGANDEPSGAVRSDTNCAESQSVAAIACGMACENNITTNMTMLRNLCLNMEPPSDPPFKMGIAPQC